ncbi:hypothetical protein PPYR_10526 [Photinus pyralis]|uniref:Gustatory receptor n=1 Tax=Photinus pyralis TaxID=7054 RepID=A0A5N4AGJ4_PHOPY|nr:uncharacterized protein LOC116175068 [Photinus pyralis]KAB0796465.1 hypothetical protein PPYR_10526 [Photinus pyralis]
MLYSFYWISSQPAIENEISPAIWCNVFYWIGTNFIEICLIIHYFVTFYEEAKKTVHIVEDLKRLISVRNSECLQVELLSIQVYTNDFKFSIYGCFLLDWRLLHSMASSIATYLVIFHQFHMMETIKLQPRTSPSND